MNHFTHRRPVAILYTNDVHCGVDQGIGFTGISVIRQALESVGKDVVLVDAGDMIQGELIGTLSEGETVIRLMNSLGYDLAVPGNHEFDFGLDRFFRLTELASFPYLAVNLTDAAGNRLLEPYRILDRGGWRIAFVGVATPKTLTTSAPGSFLDESGAYRCCFCQDETGEALYRAVQSAVDAARAEGADLVIALTHLGSAEECAPWRSCDLIAHTTGIDAVLDGHSHTVAEAEYISNAWGREVLLTSTGTKLQTLGCLTVSPEGTLQSDLIRPDYRSVLDEGKQEAEKLSASVVAHSSVDLRTTDPETGLRMVRRRETNLGDLCADAFRDAIGADLAIVNGGDFRSDLFAGELTYGDLVSALPFGDELCAVETDGQELLDLLELCVCMLPGERGSFPQVSGVTFTVDVSVPSCVRFRPDGMFAAADGERRVRDVRIGGKPLEPQARYLLASTAFLAVECGDGVSMLRDNAVTRTGRSDHQVLTDYITNRLGGTVGERYADPYGEGRITILPAEPSDARTG